MQQDSGLMGMAGGHSVTFANVLHGWGVALGNSVLPQASSLDSQRHQRVLLWGRQPIYTQ